MLPHAFPNEDRIQVLQSLLEIFKQGSLQVKLAFVENESHFLLCGYLDFLILKNDEQFLSLICDFLVEILRFGIFQEKSRKTLLLDVLQTLMANEKSSIFVRLSVQQSILHGLLLFFKEKFLSEHLSGGNNNNSNNNTPSTPTSASNQQMNWVVPFARFCVIAVNQVIQWGSRSNFVEKPFPQNQHQQSAASMETPQQQQQTKSPTSEENASASAVSPLNLSLVLAQAAAEEGGTAEEVEEIRKRSKQLIEEIEAADCWS